jgi:uncharacterized protein
MSTPQPAHTNRLANETSPYLLQHSCNPVDWYPWSDEAFEEAQRRNVPVFLSIGYSTCYWCHVMERESFESESIAKVMNEHYVCIKVDREERPDIDEIYMAATTTFTGSGGWPMSVFLEPNSRKPFYAGTYFPPEPMYNRPSFPQLLEGLAEAYKTRHAEVIEQADKLAGAVIEQIATTQAPVQVGFDQLTSATTALLTRFDQTNGGFGNAPKFPQPVFLDFLLEMRSVTDDATTNAVDLAITKTLDAMAIGGINDQIAGGFHRYSVDEFWTVPHFEKMLYDNAQLASTYTHAAQVYANPFYAGIARKTLDYCLREMTDQSQPGSTGFYSAQDAEVDGKEGLNYLWTKTQIEETLKKDTDLLKLALDIYGLNSGTNFQDPHHPNEPKRNVLRLDARPDEIATRLAMPVKELLTKMQSINDQLLKARSIRKQPGLDDKVLVSWNAMLIAALVDAGTAFNRTDYIEAAEHALGFIIKHMQSDDGELLRTYRANTAKVPAILEDYATLIASMIKLHQSPLARNKPSLDSILALADQAHAFFADTQGCYYDTKADQPDLFVRTRSFHDGAVPSAIGVMLNNLVALAELTDDQAYRAKASALLKAISPSLAEYPVSTINSTRALLTMLKDKQRYHDHYEFALPKQQSEPQASSNPKPRSPVTVMVSTESITVTDETPASFKVALEIEQGYHIVAASPGESDAAKSLIPLRVGLVSGQGIAIYADYPQGTEYGLDLVGKFNINSGRIEFDVAIEKAPGIGATPGAPVIGVSFQACNDSTCQAPQTVQLDIQIEISE